MGCVRIKLGSLRNNLERIDGLMRAYGSTWSVVTKGISGHTDTIRALRMLGVRSMMDTRIDNLITIDELTHGVEKLYLRPPSPSSVSRIVRHADGSMNSEVEIIHELSREAVRQERTHHVIIMLELGDLREGILPGELLEVFRTVKDLPNIRMAGIGGQIGCVSGLAPDFSQIDQISLYRELLQLKYGLDLPLISAGSTIFLPMLMAGELPPGLNHFRIGEALFLGTNLVSGGTMDGFCDDVIMVEAQILELKEKSMVPWGETVESTPFKPLEPLKSGSDNPQTSSQNDHRALVDVGQLDTEVSGLIPTNAHYSIVGASSDISVVSLGGNPEGLKVGDVIHFKVNYSAFVRVMSSKYVPISVTPSLSEFSQSLGDIIDIPPVMGEAGGTWCAAAQPH